MLPLAVRWVEAQRERHLPASRALTADERSALAGWFDAGLLASVRIASLAGGVRTGLGLWFVSRSFDGITLGDLVVVSMATPPAALLVHECVHVGQYARLGTRGFLRAYLGAYAGSGFRYGAIPLEREAYAVQARFEAATR